MKTATTYKKQAKTFCCHHDLSHLSNREVANIITKHSIYSEKVLKTVKLLKGSAYYLECFCYG